MEPVLLVISVASCGLDACMWRGNRLPAAAAVFLGSSGEGEGGGDVGWPRCVGRRRRLLCNSAAGGEGAEITAVMVRALAARRDDGARAAAARTKCVERRGALRRDAPGRGGRRQRQGGTDRVSPRSMRSGANRTQGPAQHPAEQCLLVRCDGHAALSTEHSRRSEPGPLLSTAQHSTAQHSTSEIKLWTRVAASRFI
jgi:hypothetical protein